MPSTDAIARLLEHVIPFTLVLFRLAGLFVAAPLLTSVVLPMKVKALLATAMAAAVYPVIRPHLHCPEGVDVVGLVPLMLGEGLVGLTIGAIAAIPILSMELAGVVMGQSIGFGLARVYNPESDVDTDLLGQMLFYVAMGVFLAAGGLEQLFGGLMRSFERVPAGGVAASSVPLDLFLAVLTSGFDLGLRVALPVVAMTLLLVIVLGVIGKTMPQLNIMTVGFTIKILAGLATFAFSVYAVREAVGEEVESVLGQALRWLDGMGGGA